MLCGDHKWQFSGANVTSIEHYYPRVLVVSLTKVKAEDPVNLIFRTQFGQWPKERIAQIYSGEPRGEGDFFGHYYKLQPVDRLFGRLFKRMRDPVFEATMALGEIEQPRIMAKKSPLRRFAQSLRKRGATWLVRSGLWEVFFHVRLSKPMAHFVQEFRPDVIFCLGYTLGFTTLPLLLARRFRLPVCFQTTDDWTQGTYGRSPVGWLLRYRARKLIVGAVVRMAFGAKMQQEYRRRYGVPFEVTYHCDDPNRFPEYAVLPGRRCRIIYTGGLSLRRHEAIQDLLNAARQTSRLAAGFEICVYSYGIPKDMPDALLHAPEVKFFPLPSHEQLPATLAEASLLLLPESFTESRQEIEYSISTKAHLYMMSRRPVLVYGPAYSGIVGYALQEGWGLVVAERSAAKLSEALTELLSGSERVHQMRARADACVRRHHDATTERERFRRMLVAALPAHQPPNGCRVS